MIADNWTANDTSGTLRSWFVSSGASNDQWYKFWLEEEERNKPAEETPKERRLRLHGEACRQHFRRPPRRSGKGWEPPVHRDYAPELPGRRKRGRRG